MSKDWTKLLELDSSRQQRYYYHYLRSQNLLPHSLLINFNIDWRPKAAAVLGFFTDPSIDEKLKNDHFGYMKAEFEFSHLPIKEFDWLESENARLCYFAWGFCRLLTRKIYLPNTSQGTVVDRFQIGYQHHDASLECHKTDFNKNPINAKECREAVICFFDMIPDPPDHKVPTINTLKQFYGYCFDAKHKIQKHLDRENTSHGVWMWDYLRRKQEIRTDFIFPSSEKEKFDCAQLAIDIWDAHPDTKRIFLNKMYTAFYGRKSTESISENKGESFWLGKEETRKLKELAKRRGLSTREYLKELITLQHDGFDKK